LDPDPEILADHCVSEPTIALLRASGYTVTRLVDVANPGMADAQVAALATRRGCILLTEDRDFKTRVVYHQRKHPGVILLRDTATHRQSVHRRLLRLLASPPQRMTAALVVIDRRSCRVIPTR
jgi:predicted nuclease of predicted toxin-antitoxin system